MGPLTARPVISDFTILVAYVIMVACVGAIIVILWHTRRQRSEAFAPKQLLLPLVGYLLALLLAGPLISPTGPGSERTVYIVLVVYSCLLALVGSKPVKVLGLVLAIAFLIGVGFATKSKLDFERRMETIRRMRSVSPEEPAAAPTENSVRNGVVVEETAK